MSAAAAQGNPGGNARDAKPRAYAPQGYGSRAAGCGGNTPAHAEVNHLGARGIVRREDTQMRSIRQRPTPPVPRIGRRAQHTPRRSGTPRFPGQSLVEFGLITLLLLTMVAGVVDLGRGVYSRPALSNAVREAARYGATNPRNSQGIINAAKHTSPGLNLAVTGADPTQDELLQSFALNDGAIRCTDRNYAAPPDRRPPRCRSCPAAWRSAASYPRSPRRASRRIASATIHSWSTGSRSGKCSMARSIRAIASASSSPSRRPAPMWSPRSPPG